MGGCGQLHVANAVALLSCDVYGDNACHASSIPHSALTLHAIHMLVQVVAIVQALLVGCQFRFELAMYGMDGERLSIS